MSLRIRTLGLVGVLLAVWALLGLLSWPPLPPVDRHMTPPMEDPTVQPAPVLPKPPAPTTRVPPPKEELQPAPTALPLVPTPPSPQHRRGHQCEEGLQTALQRITHQAPPFSQVHSHNIGPVRPDVISSALAQLGRKVIPLGRTNITTPDNIVLFAMDGTLLNLLRWGQIVNDNDIDLGFYLGNVSHLEGIDGLPAMPLMDQYVTLYRALGLLGVVDPPSERNIKKLHHRYAPVKMGRCLHRRHGMMQCRDRRSGVHIDIFGPDVLFRAVGGRTVLTRRMIEPLQACFVAGGVFPCPADPVGVLTTFELNLSPSEGGGSSSDAAPRYNEFKGCALFPPSKKERTHHHLNSIIAAGRVLQGCGFPTLLKQLPHPSCDSIMQGPEEPSPP